MGPEEGAIDQNPDSFFSFAFFFLQVLRDNTHSHAVKINQESTLLGSYLLSSSLSFLNLVKLIIV